MFRLPVAVPTFAALAVAALAFAAPAFAQGSDYDTFMTACRTHDGGLPDAACQCIARGMTQKDFATYAQFVKARLGSDSEAAEFERRNAAFIAKFDGIVRRCTGG